MATTTDVRKWAKERGIDVGVKGPISPAVLEQYDQAHAMPGDAAAITAAEFDAELSGEVVTADDVPAADSPALPASGPGAAETRPKRPPRAPPAAPGTGGGRGLRGLFGGRSKRAAAPRSHKARPKITRTSLAPLIEDLWADMAWAAAPIPPMQRLLYAQAPMAGMQLETAFAGTFLDRALQPVARAEDKAKAAGGLVCPPVALMLVLATAPAPELDANGVPVAWPEPTTEHKAALLMLRWSLILMQKAGQAKLEDYVVRAEEAAARGRQADAFMTWILGGPAEPPAGNGAGPPSAEDEAITRARLLFGAPAPAADGDGPA